MCMFQIIYIVVFIMHVLFVGPTVYYQTIKLIFPTWKVLILLNLKSTWYNVLKIQLFPYVFQTWKVGLPIFEITYIYILMYVFSNLTVLKR